jgi:hypothetical protein
MRTALLILPLVLIAAAARADAPGEPAVVPQRAPIIGGRDLQPRPEAPPEHPASTGADRLLRENPDPGPVPPPHDLYGHRLDAPSGTAPGDGAPPR